MSNSKKFYTKMILTYAGIFTMIISFIFMIVFSIIIDDEEFRVANAYSETENWNEETDYWYK